LGWLTVVVYLVAALASFICAWRVQDIFGPNNLWEHRLVWGGLAFGLLFLGINKQLDLQSLFTAVVKIVAYEQGWYALGQRAQVYFILVMGLVSLVLLASLAWQMRHQWRRYWLILLGLLFLARFIIVRAASFYAVPLPELSRLTGGIKVTWLLEILGSFLIAVAAIYNIRFKNTR
jgi:hypothetical protein